MPRRFDPKYNDEDRHKQYGWDDASEAIRREAGGIDYVPDAPFIPSSSGGDGPYTPPATIRDE